MKDVKWIKIVTDMFDNRKIRQIECLPEGDSIIVIWMKLLCLAADTNDLGFIYFTKDVPYTEEMLATEFNRPLNTVKLALLTFEKYGMIEVVEDIIRVSNWERYQSVDGMEMAKLNNAERQRRWRERQKLLKQNNEQPSEQEEENVTLRNVTDNVTVTPFSYSYSISNNNIDNYKYVITNNIYAEYISENPQLGQAIENWMAYKDEKKPKKENHYSKRGMEMWIKKMCEACKEYGVDNVVSCIEKSISNEWKGVYGFDQLKQKKQKKPSGIEGIEDW